MNKTYRTDIDGLRAIAVISVILFHLGYLSNGYLGVDIFFVISGYLITGIVYGEVAEKKFSVLKFYERRIRRIIPLVLFTTLTAFILGLIFMLPDDLENLCQSVFASNLSANNILMKITSADYWAVKNDYKPLMHTWSLGVEEQFYLLYPFIFFFLKDGKQKFILPLLMFLTLLSLASFFTSNNVSSKFYFLQHRFFELSIGGMCSIYFGRRNPLIIFSKSHYVLLLLLFILVFLLYFNPIKGNDIQVLITTVLTAGILVLGGLHFENNSLYKALISNRLFVGIGKISFSLYMWHQIVFAFSRYLLVDEITLSYAVVLSIIVAVLSITTYFGVENPFRNRKLIKTKPLLILVSFLFIIITSASLYVYMVGGNIKNVPELGLNRSNRPSQLNLFSSESNINIQYNEDVRTLDKPFSDDKQGIGKIDKIKVLVLGNSFGRDVANVLLESCFKDSIEVRYSDLVLKSDDELKQRIGDADFIFFGSNYTIRYPTEELVKRYNIDMNKVWIVGTKDFGNSNGIHYNRKIENYSNYRASMKSGVLESNRILKKEWGERYIDLIDLIADSKGKVLVFTPEGKFISQDTAHFTKYGARFFAALLRSKFREIMKLI
jgi:peptidoglycan/LPS O-acetylase OafA/YrhL